MNIDSEWFLERYGKIKVLDEVKYRNPVLNTCQKDKNRSLMLKFKYGNLSPSEEIEFHEAVKNLIYKVMHTNNVMMDWDDVYQEIWRKIIKSKHSWDEDKGTYASTWITIVASTVISTLRANVNKMNSRYCLYDDILPASSESDDAGTDYKMDSLNQESGFDQEEDPDPIKKVIWKEQYEIFLKSLDPAEASVMQGISSMEDKFIAAADKGGGKMPFSELREKLGYDESTFNILLYNIRRKYCEAFDKEFLESSSSSNEELMTDLLF